MLTFTLLALLLYPDGEPLILRFPVSLVFLSRQTDRDCREE
jgi:hypothetical protein